MAPRLTLPELTHACHQAWVIHDVNPSHIEACLARNPRKHGVAKLRLAYGADVILSELEARFIKLLADHGLPLPRTNIDVHGDKVDCHWPEIGLTIELLSYRYHGSREAFETDIARRRRSNHVQFTWGDVFERAEQTVAEVREVTSVEVV